MNHVTVSSSPVKVTLRYGQKGERGIGISSVALDDKAHLIITYADENIKVGDITPQEIDGFKIIEMMDYGYGDAGESEGFSGLSLEANRKCILHIKGEDYSLTHQSGPDLYDNTASDNAIGIEDNEQIKVTYTLL